MTVREAAARLEVSEDTIYGLCRAGRLAHVRIGLGRRGGAIRISESDLAAFLAGARSAPPAEPEPPASPRPRRRGPDVVDEILARKRNRIKI